MAFMPETTAPSSVSTNSTLAYRLIKERFLDNPLSSEGARRYGGRWNPPGIGILYTSASPELTLLEQLVHFPALPYQDLPKLSLITLALPSPPKIVDNLSQNWRDSANFEANYLSPLKWLDNPDILALRVPSAIVPESYNFLLHPPHKDYTQIEIISVNPFVIDPRLWNHTN